MLDYDAKQRLKERFYPQARADALGALWQALDRHLPPTATEPTIADIEEGMSSDKRL